MLLATIPIVVGIIGSKLLVNSWQIRKEKFALRREILTNFEETWPRSSSMIYELYQKVGHSYAKIDSDGHYHKGGSSDAIWTYPKIDSEKPFNKFDNDLLNLNVQLSKIGYKINGFRGLIALYFKDSKKIIELFDMLQTDIHKYHFYIDRMIHAENIDELMENNGNLLTKKSELKEKIHALEKILIETELKNPKT